MKQIDKFQERYLNHQKKKAKVLAQIVAERHSERQFGSKEVDLLPVYESILRVPSSCGRKAVEGVVAKERDEKNMLGGLLVGGVGWVHRAQVIILLFADPVAYKAGDEIKYMPYLDAGVMAQQALLTATSLGYASCFVNPNIRPAHKPSFDRLFNPKGRLFVGAIAVGSKHD